MAMSFEEAQKIERPLIQVGDSYSFYSTMREEYKPKHERMNQHTAHYVTVIEIAFDPSHADWIEGESERSFKVRAKDGSEFYAIEGELNGWFRDTGQFYNADGTWGHKRNVAAGVKGATPTGALSSKTRQGLADFKNRQGG